MSEPLVRYTQEDKVAGVARLYAYTPQLASLLPMALAEASAGRPEPFMAQAAMVENLIGEQISLGLQLSVACAEDVDLLTPDPRDEGTLLGTAFVNSTRAMCEVWPRARVPAISTILSAARCRRCCCRASTTP